MDGLMVISRGGIVFRMLVSQQKLLTQVNNYHLNDVGLRGETFDDCNEAYRVLQEVT